MFLFSTQTNCYSIQSVKTWLHFTNTQRFCFPSEISCHWITKNHQHGNVNSRGHIDTERSRMAYSLAKPMPLCLRGPIGDTTGVSIWQAFNRSTMSASYKHWINIDAFHFHSQQCTDNRWGANIQRSCGVHGKITDGKAWQLFPLKKYSFYINFLSNISWINSQIIQTMRREIDVC